MSLRRHAGLAAVLVLAAGYAWPMQGVGFNQNSHYALVKALADGTPQIDRTMHEVGELSTQDVTVRGGHVYSNKAPGLAFATLPAFVVLEAVGARTVGDPTRMLWALGLVGVVLPATLLVLLVRRVAERIEPGFGTAAAVALGLGTLLMPFATLFFSHALSAMLVFAAFALLFRERLGPPRVALVACAGLLAGLGVTTEYPNAFAALVLGLYAVGRRGWPSRGLAYSAGVVAGILPLAAYNRWAFGSSTHLSYDALTDQELGELRVPVAYPTPEVLLETLFGRSGLLTLAPVLVVGMLGTVLLYRRGWRAEALVVAAVAALYLLYNSSYGPSFGGYSAGQRYLIPIVPFLALPLGLAFRRFPVTTGALALVSAVIAVAITATHALAGYNLGWFDRIASGQFTSTAASLLDVTGWYTILPFFLAAAAAAALALLATARPRLAPGDTLAAPAAVLAWALVAATAPAAPALGGRADELSAYAGVAVAAAAAICVALLATRLRRV